jgi:hypothetical protein
MGSTALSAALQKPWVLVGGVVRHVIKDDPEASLMRGRHQLVKRPQIAEAGIDVDIIGHILPEVRHR